MSILDPFVLWDTGFQLSFLGTLGIVLFTPYVQRLFHPIHAIPGGHFLAETSSVTIAAQMATLPIFAITFQQVSFISPIANMLTVPLLGIVITLGLLICTLGLCFFPLGTLTGWVAWPFLWYMSHCILWCASLPGAYVLVTNLDDRIIWIYYLPLTLLLVFLLKRWPLSKPASKQNTSGFQLSKGMRRLLYAGTAFVIIAMTGLATIRTQANGQLEVTFLSVGPAGKSPQGEAILVRTADNQTLLIDGGLDPTSLGQKLDSHLPAWQRSLDMIILTSPRSDHLTGLQDVVSRYQVGTILDAGMLYPSAAYASWQRTIREKNIHYHLARQGQTLPLGKETQIQILWPPPVLHAGSNNIRDNSLIFRLITPGLRFLFLGATAQSDYALSGLQTQIVDSAQQAEIVQIVYGAGQSVTNDLQATLKEANSSLLVVTPPITRTTQKSIAIPSNAVQTTFSSILPSVRIMSTVQMGDIDIVSDGHTWKANTS
jgi:beta-lactamase superfamily II metal-dependent hydrolase